MGATAQDVFSQLHAEAQGQTSPAQAGDVFSQIHAQNQASATATAQAPEQQMPQPSMWAGPNAQDAAIWAQTQKGYPTATNPKTIGAVAGSIVAPALAPETGWFMHALLTGAGGAVGTAAGQAASGQNPLTTPSLQETGANAAAFASMDALFGALPAVARAKFGRSIINESLGATGRDVIYGNPAKAITSEGITSPFTGDIEAMKAAGNDLTAAGGRLGQVAQRVAQLQPQLNAALSRSSAPIKVADVIDKPLTDAFNDIMNNSAMTDAEKMTAITQLGGLQASLKQGLGDTITPLQANQLKNLIGSRVRWTGTNAVGDEVRPAYKDVYVSLKNAVNGAVPGVSQLNDRLTDLYAAQDDLLDLARNEEAGRGRGFLRGTTGTTLAGALQSAAGRFLPGAAGASGAAGMAVRPFIPPAIGSATNPDIRASFGRLVSLRDLQQ